MTVSVFAPVLASSILALGTTVHLALSALRHHRRPGPGAFSSLTLISLSLSVTPWLFPSALGLAVGVAIHAAWFSACERLVPSKPVQRAAVPAPVVIDRPAGVERRGGVERRANGFVQAPVLAVFEETPDIRTFRMARPDGFDFVAGQFLPVRVKVDGKDHVRCYSISSSPAASGYLEISVKRQGLVSGTLAFDPAAGRAPVRASRRAARSRTRPATIGPCCWWRAASGSRRCSACCATRSRRSPRGA